MMMMMMMMMMMRRGRWRRKIRVHIMTRMEDDDNNMMIWWKNSQTDHIEGTLRFTWAYSSCSHHTQPCHANILFVLHASRFNIKKVGNALHKWNPDPINNTWFVVAWLYFTLSSPRDLQHTRISHTPCNPPRELYARNPGMIPFLVKVALLGMCSSSVCWNNKPRHIFTSSGVSKGTKKSYRKVLCP